MTGALRVGELIRAATPTDQKEIERLLCAGGMFAKGVDAYAGEFFIAEANNEIIATVALEEFGGDALLRWVYVDPAWRGHGVARRIVEHVLTVAALRVIDSLYLFCSSTERFFVRFGFMSVARADLPSTIRRASERAGSYADGATAMHLRLAEP